MKPIDSLVLLVTCWIPERVYGAPWGVTLCMLIASGAIGGTALEKHK